MLFNKVGGGGALFKQQANIGKYFTKISISTT